MTTTISRRLSQLPTPSAITLNLPTQEWKPDKPEFGNDGVTVARNVVPSANGFRPLPQLVAQGSALAGQVRGARTVRATSGVTYIYAGIDAQLYEGIGGTFTDESKSGGYSTGSEESWEFAVFGDRVIASNFTDPVQSMTIGGGGSGAFADLFTSTLKPKARHIDIVREFLVLGYTNDAIDGVKPNRVWWSAINDPTDADPDAATQCDIQDLPDGGAVQRIVGGVEYGIVFQEHMIRRMTFVGAPLIFEIVAVDRQRGTPIANSVIAHGRTAFFIAEEGFFATDGYRTDPIGDGKVDRTFWSIYDANHPRAVSATIDRTHKLIMWAVPTAGGAGKANRMFIFNWVTGGWSEAELDLDLLFPVRATGYTLEQMDAFGSNIDAWTQSYFDHAIWRGGKYLLGAFQADHKLALFSGPPLVARVVTGEYEPNPGGMGKIREVWPAIDTSMVMARQIVRDTQNNAVRYGTWAPLDAEGKCCVFDSGRFHRTEIEIAHGAEWTVIQGLRVIGTRAGKR